MQFSKDKRQETIIYLVVWGLLFITPVINLYIRTVNDDQISFEWSEVFMVWRQFGIYFAIFLVHNHLLAPLLVYQQRKILYSSFIVALIALFTIYQCNSVPDFKSPRETGGILERPRPTMHDFDGERPAPHDFDGKRPTPPNFDGDRPTPPDFEGKRPAPPEMNDMEDHKTKRPPLIIGQHDIVAIIVLILMVLANLGLKSYFKNRGDQQRLKALEHQNLEQQLEYLKYQINPHFLMNTLNNIHALVDIDPEQAKDTILELSRLLRFVLYEGNKPTVPLNRELDFLEEYIKLMRMRYTDKVKISLSRPETNLTQEIPPLLFITFVENAFKHGVSYQHQSFIDVSIIVEEKQLCFKCSNSKKPKDEDKTGGVGLKNARQRLDLTYGKNYTLNIFDDSANYNVELRIPIT